jgi:hypothetical protein
LIVVVHVRRSSQCSLFIAEACTFIEGSIKGGSLFGHLDQAIRTYVLTEVFLLSLQSCLGSKAANQG